MKGTQRLRNASPVILTGLSVVGVVGTALMASRATPKALSLIDDEVYDRYEKSESEKPFWEWVSPKNNSYGWKERANVLTPFEMVRTTWKCYIPAALIGASTIACIVGINVFNKRSQASLASAYALVNQAYQGYRKAAKTVYGEDADSQIKAQAARETFVSADGYGIYSPDMDENSEKKLFYDDFSQRYFTSTMAAVLNAQYHLNRNLTLRGDASVNEFYEFMGVDQIDCGDDIGWSLDELLEGGIQWLDFENRPIKLDDGLECCLISALYEPTSQNLHSLL